MKLYYNDSYCKAFTTKIVDVITEKGKVAVVLEDTAFYPEGGGQPSDQGTLESWSVVDVRERGGAIYHYLESSDSMPKVGDVVQGTIDWNRRFAHMQNHTGEHLFSGLVHSQFGYENVGFHMGSQEVTMDFSGELTGEQLQKLELEANQIIWENQTNLVYYPTKEELVSLEYRSKKEIDGQLRMVEIGGVDRCACCGTHTATTAEVGMLKILSHCRYKGGTRVAILCGGPLLTYLQNLMAQTIQIGNSLSVKQTGLADAVERQKQELVESKYSRDQWQKTALASQAEVLLAQPHGENLVCHVLGLTVQTARMLATTLAENVNGVTMVYGDGAYGVASKSVDVRGFTKALNQLTQGKGGGGPQATQGSYAQGEDEIPNLFHQHFPE